MVKQFLKKTWVYPIYLSLTRKSSENKYYARLFIEDKVWNTSSPNGEEKARWNIIESFTKEAIKISGKIKPDILDLGCGRGWLSSLLSGYGNVTGIEPVKPVSLYAQKLFPNLQMMHGTSKTLLDSGKTSSYDMVVSSEVIEHVKDSKKRQFVQDISSLLRENGFAIISTPRKEAEEDWKKHTSPGQPVEEWITEKDARELFTNNGFEVVSHKRIPVKLSKEEPATEVYQVWLFRKLKIN